MKLHELLAEDMVLLDLCARDREGVLREMAGYLTRKASLVEDEDLAGVLLRREMLTSTAVGEGFAIPHCKLAGIPGPLVLAGLSRRGVAFHSLDGKPSHVFFLVVSPANDPGLNLRILAAIAHLVRRGSGLLPKVLTASTPEAVLRILRQEDEESDG